ncbi:hypothetical protein [Metabacillus litoralis]|uniref:hypothetical protein n=1 Tax=Metabacillus litoralis TaxID=152268 RepID=UPI00203D770F|nr:hypothetical protein [Metabacillus litoralis]
MDILGYSLDLGRIGTETVEKNRLQSRYKQNWDRNRRLEQANVPIQVESGHKSVERSGYSLDTSRIGTEIVGKIKLQSRYR